MSLELEEMRLLYGCAHSAGSLVPVMSPEGRENLRRTLELMTLQQRSKNNFLQATGTGRYLPVPVFGSTYYTGAYLSMELGTGTPYLIYFIT